MKKSGSKTKLMIWVVLLVQYLFMGGYVMQSVLNDLKAVAEQPECATILDLEIMNVTAEKVEKSLGCMGEQGRAVYLVAATVHDSIYPISYGLFLAFTIYCLASFLGFGRLLVLFLTLVPVVILPFDYVENHYIAQLINQYPDLQPASINGVSTANKLKWILVLVSFALVLGLGGVSLVKLVRKR